MRCTIGSRIVFQMGTFTTPYPHLYLLLQEEGMVRMPVLCHHCHSDQVIKGGKTTAGQQRYTYQNVACPHANFQLDLVYKGRAPAIKEQIVETCLHGSSIRDTARVLQISPTTVMNGLKKTRVVKLAGVSASPASRDMIRDHGESADAGFVADGESPVPAAALAKP